MRLEKLPGPLTHKKQGFVFGVEESCEGPALPLAGPVSGGYTNVNCNV